MPDRNREVRPGLAERTVRLPDGTVLRPPSDWALLPPGDALLTRRVKAGGPCWTVRERHRNRWESRGIWAPAERIERLRAEVEQERRDPGYQRRLAAGRARRAAEQGIYAAEFEAAVRAFLAFAPAHAALAEAVAQAIARHATPVGSGTVARTERIPVPQRAEAATIAWLRHQTTGYDHMSIARVKGRRREVRRLLAEQSRALLQTYRQGVPVDPARCPLRLALAARQGA